MFNNSFLICCIILQTIWLEDFRGKARALKLIVEVDLT